MIDKYQHLRSTLYEENQEFLRGQRQSPINIDEIRYNILISRYSNLHTTYKRIILGLGGYTLAVSLSLIGVYLTKISIDNQQYYMVLYWIVAFPLSVITITKFALNLLRDKSKEINKMITKFITDGQFYNGKILQKSFTSDKDLTIYYTFFGPENNVCIGKYLLLDTSHDVDNKYVVVWYVDDTNNTLL